MIPDASVESDTLRRGPTVSGTTDGAATLERSKTAASGLTPAWHASWKGGQRPMPSVDRDPSTFLADWRDAATSTLESWRSALISKIGRNVASGVTVALVALPLNMALAIACGLPASVGLVTGAIAGVVGALLGGSRLQITGPEVALAPITFEIVAKHGLEGLLVVTFLAGLLQIALGLLRIGRLVHAIPVPVIGGFLAAVGIMVFDSQLPVLLGVSDEARVVTELTPSLLGSVSLSTVAIGLVVVATMVGLPKLSRRVPAPLVALLVAMVIVAGLDLPVAMVSAFEGGFATPSAPSFAGLPLAELAVEAVALALIASIDSLLCAVSIDARTGGPRTRTDQELVAQGIANLGSACFGGMPVAAAIVRSAAAVEAGATSRVAPLSQSIVLAIVLLALAPLLAHIPLVALASILLVVGWRLVDWGMVRHMWHGARFEVAVLVATTAGILATDFVRGVLLGVLIALAEFAHRQGRLLRTRRAVWRTDVEGVRVMRLEGPIFFAAQSKIDLLFDGITDAGPLVIDLAAVPTLDSSGAGALGRAIERMRKRGNEVWLTALSDEAHTLLAPALSNGDVRVADHLQVALRKMRISAGDGGIDTPSTVDRSDGRWRHFVASVALDRS